MPVQTALIITLIILILDILVIALTYILKRIRTRRQEIQAKIEGAVAHKIAYEEIDLRTIHPERLLDAFCRLTGDLRIEEEKYHLISELLLAGRLPGKYMKRLSSRSFITRAEAAFKLKFLKSAQIQEALLEALDRERNPVTTLYISQALAAQKVTKAIPLIVRKLRSMNPWYAQRIRAVLYTYGKDFLRYAKYRTCNSRAYMQRLICEFALDYPAEELRSCLIVRAQSSRRDIRSLAQKALLRHFPDELLKEPFISSSRRDTLSNVILAYGSTNDADNIQPILSYGRILYLHQFIVYTLSEMAFKNSVILSEILSIFTHATRKREQMLLAKVLANRIDYYLTRINTPKRNQVVSLITELVEAKHISAIFVFLNRNHDQAIEDSLIEVLQKLIQKHSHLKQEMRQYLDDDIYRKFNIREPAKKKEHPAPHSEEPQTMKLAVILAAVVVFFPFVIFANEFAGLVQMGWGEIGRLYVVRFNYLLVFYSLAINSIYLLILGFSTIGVRTQSRLGRIKDRHFLFTRHLLPSVTIIAPAYNEAANIIESTNSLLNQRYPEFELIVVNDGSKDDTLKTIISYFKLEKQDMILNNRLKTRKLRGIYTSRNIPNLIVVDKMNGGKADSLNMGLNIASKEFFCGIDADSLLEPDSLLNAVSVMIDTPEESVAAGGNIFPVNGCTVDHGALDRIALPKKFLPRLQSLEYIRAFMSGRVGWAYINTLLIISGAFGIFDREIAISTGGYLTKSGKFRRDTVGEDMELVVRISRHMREKKKPYRIDYAFNANCWTEVPESWRVLRRQRDRWHRGLVDIMLFHHKLIANPKYGKLGMVGMLYYFLFEFIGPFIEIQGLIMVVISAAIGALNATIALLLFSTTILLGILVSASSVLLAEFNRKIYTPRDVARLLWMAVVENFGVRQLVSLWRVQGYFSAMGKAKGWGAQTRKGFSSAKK